MRRLVHSEDGDSVVVPGLNGFLVLSADDADALAVRLQAAAARARQVNLPAGWAVTSREVMVSSGTVQAIVNAERP